MTPAICRDCATDVHLKAIIEDEDAELICTQCGEAKRPAISVEALAASIEPIMREHFRPGRLIEGLQDGRAMDEIIHEVVGQDLDFADDLIDEIIALDPADPTDGGEPLWDHHTYYVETRVTPLPGPAHRRRERPGRGRCDHRRARDHRRRPAVAAGG